uniref:Uncharacterized protein n=1 Tax=Glossina pallidipes TaxID=7398 RepID=A0A1A9ZI09_GLOPL
MWKALHKLTAKFITYQEMVTSFKYSMSMQLGLPMLRLNVVHYYHRIGLISSRERPRWDVFTRYVKAIREVVEASKPANIMIILSNFNLCGWCVNDGNGCMEPLLYVLYEND